MGRFPLAAVDEPKSDRLLERLLQYAGCHFVRQGQPTMSYGTARSPVTASR